MREDGQMPQNRSNVSVAVTTISKLCNGILYQSHVAAHRNEIGLMQILTQEQTIAFLDWFATNKERCGRLFGLDEHVSKQHSLRSSGVVEPGVGIVGAKQSHGKLKMSDSLTDICGQLTEAMMIAKTEL